MDSNHLDRSLFIKSVKDPTKSDPDNEVAWEHLLTHLFRVRLEIKKNLAFNSNPDMPPGVDKSPESRQRNDSKLRKSSVNSELKTKHIPIAHKPTWMNSFLQSTGTITSHDDPKVQKLREDQSKFSTKFSINTLITCLFFIAVWSMIGGFKSPVTKIASLRRP